MFRINSIFCIMIYYVTWMYNNAENVQLDLETTEWDYI